MPIPPKDKITLHELNKAQQIIEDAKTLVIDGKYEAAVAAMLAARKQLATAFQKTQVS